MADQPPTLGQRLQALRRERAWSLTVMARAAGLGRTYLYEVEADRAHPTLRWLEQLAGALELSVLEVLGPIYGDDRTVDRGWDRVQGRLAEMDRAVKALHLEVVTMAQQELRRRYLDHNELAKED